MHRMFSKVSKHCHLLECLLADVDFGNRWLCFSLMSLIKCYIKRFMLTVCSVIDKNIMQQLCGSLILQSTVLLCSCSPFSDLTWEVYKNTMLQIKVLFVTCCSCSCIEFWMRCENRPCRLCTASRWLDHDCSQFFSLCFTWSPTESFHKAVIGYVSVPPFSSSTC